MMIMCRGYLLLLASVAIILFCQNVFTDAQLLPESEVQGLRDVAEALGKKNWNFSADPCSGQYGWFVSVDNAVSCNCSFASSTICHVTSIFLKAENLQGTLPKDLSGLPFLEQFDVTRNYLNGSIPSEWGTSKLVNISLLANRLTGSIPKELGNISTLQSLVLEINQLSGKLPPELGNLINIKRLLLTSNNFTGELPATFANLTALEDFRISDNSFSGPIPDFIQKWTKLKKIAIQASGLSGPIPSGIASLAKITDMRITDLSGPEATFPPLKNLTKMKTLFLRNCNLTGAIPDYLQEMSSLKELDLSFNKLSGVIPDNLVILKSIDYIFLTRNNLSGTVPDWLLRGGESIDLSYNNFTTQSSTGLECQQRNVNLFESSIGSNKSIASCLRSTQCSQTHYSLHINCGGKEVTVNGTKYEDDSSVATSSSFCRSKTNWGVSTTGFFTDDNSPIDFYITSNTSKLLMNNSELYTRARLTPITLTYYAFCMGNGNYTVDLHFAEIVFTNDNTYSSLGRRVFDVYIQGELVLKDFDISREAGGAAKEVIKTFIAYVTSNTLEIRFYWAGKGTTAIPDRGVYGPLVSAISVKPNFTPPVPPVTTSEKSISTGAIVGITVGGTLALVAIVGLLWWKFCLTKKSDLNRDLKSLDLKTGKFTLRQIKAATNNFDAANKIGEGGFGCVYKGLLADGSIIAVKQLSSKSKQGNREFLNEIGMISALQHPHLVKLYGCCIEGDQLLLVYEYMENNNVGRALFGPEESQINLDWPTRSKICIGIARGLAFLHEESRLKIVHRDIKATNILLDKDLSPKISDFGLAKLDEEENTHISTRIAGTYGYMAPEYAMRGHLTDKADVYSYGIVVLEIISGRSNTTYRGKDDSFYLLDWALVLKENGDLMKLVDPRLGTDYDREEVLLTINVALQCADVSPTVRPSMSSVVSILEGKVPLQDFVSDTTSTVSKDDISEMRRQFRPIQEESQSQSMSMEGPWTGSTASVADLYPVNPDSDYWQNRN